MSTELIQYAFVAGEISETLYGRTDLTKYDMGVALAKNFFVDYRGGLSTRPGTEFGDFVKHGDKETKFVPFQFSPDLTNTYELLFGHNYIRFIQDNAYILEEPQNISNISGAVFTIVDHGYVTGDWVKLSGLPSVTFFTYIVTKLSEDTFTLTSVFDDSLLTLSAPYTGGAELARVYEIISPYSGDELAELNSHQIRDLIRLCHPEHPIRNLIRNDHTEWFIEEEVIGGLLPTPQNITAVASAAGGTGNAGKAEIVYTVTAVFEDGVESQMAVPQHLYDIVNYTVTQGSVTFSWDRVPGAVSYNIYRSHVSSYTNSPKLTAGVQLGYIGKTNGLTFTDPNIVADFTKTPPNRYNPFAPGRINSISVDTSPSGSSPFSMEVYTDGDGTDFMGYTGADAAGNLGFVNILNGGFNYETPVFIFGASIGSGFTGRAVSNSHGKITGVTVLTGGSGYSANTTILASAPNGKGFLGKAVVSGGVITGVTVISQGSGYPLPFFITLIVAGSNLAGAAFSYDISPLTGTYPRVSTVFQQRQIYAASINNPLTFWASRPNKFSNFDYGEITLDNDYYEYDVDSADISPIMHMYPTRGGLLLMSQTGIWQLTGGQTGPVTPSNALADPQTYSGVSRVPPIRLGTDLIYIEGKGYAVRLLSYNEFSRVYSGEDKSLLSNHLFSLEKQITSWAFAENPSKLIWAVRSDGAIVMFTVVKEQDVFAWTWGVTKGKFKTISVIDEDGYDRVYVTATRIIAGKTRTYFERMALRDFDNVEDSWCVDAGLRMGPTKAAGTLQISPIFTKDLQQYVTLTADQVDFTGKEEHWVRGGQGIFVIKTVLSSTEAEAFVVSPPTNIIEEDTFNRFYEITDWTIGGTFKTFTGLWHLEGEEVAIQGDGSVFPNQTVVNGSITLPDAVSKVTIGLPYTPVMRTLPPTVQEAVIEARRKRVVGVGIRLHESRGLESGYNLNNTYPLRERTNEAYATPTLLMNGIRYTVLETDWDEDGQTYFIQRKPLPATILGLVPDLEVGDDPD